MSEANRASGRRPQAAGRERGSRSDFTGNDKINLSQWNQNWGKEEAGKRLKFLRREEACRRQADKINLSRWNKNWEKEEAGRWPADKQKETEVFEEGGGLPKAGLHTKRD